MKKLLLITTIFAALFSIFPSFAGAATRSDGKEIVELTAGIEHVLTEGGFTTYVDVSQLPDDVAANFRRIGVASYGGMQPDVSRFEGANFLPLTAFTTINSDTDPG